MISFADRDAPPTIGERYSSAVQSSNLRAEGGRRGDVDLLIASGKVGQVDPLGASFYRLAVEFDNSRSELDQARRWAAQQQREATALLAMADFFEKAPAEDEGQLADHARKAAKARSQAAQVQEAAEASVKTELALALMRMQSLREARVALGRLASIEATRQGFMQPERIVMVLAQKVLEGWLSPHCPKCDGRGFTGGAYRNDKQIPCRPCKGVGARRDKLGQGPEQERFCTHLKMMIDQRLAEVDFQMRTWMQ